MSFDRHLNEAIESSVGGESSMEIEDLLAEIGEAQSYLDSLTSQLDGKVEELCATVSTELKRLLPKVDAKLSKGGVIFSYYSRSLGIRPDIEEQKWVIEPGEGPRERAMGRKFMADWNETPLGKWKDMIHALAELFTDNYKTLQGGNVELPKPKKDKSELPDEDIDKAIDNVGATSPTPVNDLPVTRKGGSKSPGSTYYA